MGIQMKNHMFFGLLALVLAPTSAFAAEATVVSVCNHNTDRVIYAAHMKQRGAGAGWQSTGWFKAAAGQCTDVNLGTYSGKVFLYAQDEFLESYWGEGSVTYCVKQGSAFSINNADTLDCAAGGLARVSSDELTVGPGKTVWDVHPNYAQLSLCNRNAGFSVYAAVAKPDNGRLRSKGWYEIAAGACRTITIGRYTGPVSYFASRNQLEWTGSAAPFCVNRTLAFDIQEADKPSSCTGTGLEMIRPREVSVSAGVTTVELEPKAAETTLSLCNDTDKLLYSARALAAGAFWESTGWTKLEPKQCVSSSLGTYQGTVHVYAEYNEGELYWGSGPFNFCVHRTDSFRIADAANEALCNADIHYKQVPSFTFEVQGGTNTFHFNP